MLARLFEIVSTRICWAAMPVAAILRTRMSVSFPGLAGECVERGHHPLVFGLEKALPHLVGALHLDHAGDLADGIDVGAFEKSLKDAGVLLRDKSAFGPEHHTVLAHQNGAFSGLDEADLCKRAAIAAEGAIGRQA